jgi:CrcB protein
MNFLIVFFGAGVGGALRHGVNTLGMRFLGTNFPYGTLTVNIAGSLAMGPSPAGSRSGERRASISGFS